MKKPKQDSETIASSENDTNEDSADENDDQDTATEERYIKVQGRDGMYQKTSSMNDKYDARPKGVKDLTLSQFATSYTKCAKRPKHVEFNENGVTNETGHIECHFSEKKLPLYIRLSTKDIYKLRRFSTVLRIHSSSKKTGDEEYFAEMQLFSPWRAQGNHSK